MNISQHKRYRPSQIFHDFLRELQSGTENQLCSICRSINLDRQAYSSDPEDNDTTVLGPLADIIRRRSCPLCQLVLQLVTRNGVPSDSIEDMNGDPKKPESVCKLRRSGNLFEVRDSYGLQGYICHSTEDNLPGNAIHGLECLGVAFGLQLDIGLLRTWISDCEHTHVTCREIEGSANNHEAIDLLLIDVRHNRLIDASPSHRYIALSYVWGSIRMLQTTKANYQALRKDGALAELRDQIPRVILDAMKLVIMLNERYLWVDSLCIVQDDTAQKHDQIKNMNIVYGQAFLTIISLSGKDANASLPGVSPRSRFPLFSAIELGGRRFFSRPLSLRSLLSQSPYETRAWTYQERLLSRRCLILTWHQAYLHCRSLLQCDVAGLKQEENAEQVAAINPLATIVMQSPLSFEVKPGPWGCRGFLLYDELVRSYTRRELSYPADMLSAFAGIEAVLKRYFGSNFISGLPEGVLDIALLWVSTEYKRSSDSHETEGKSFQRNRHFSSWSWAGQGGSVGYLGGPLDVMLTTGIPGLRPDIGSVSFRNRDRIRVIQRQKREFLQNQDTAPPSPAEPILQPNLSSKVEVLFFDADSAPAHQFLIRQYDWDPSRVLIYDRDNHCCGRIWPDDAGCVQDPNASTRALVRLSSTDVPNIAEHLQLGYHFATRSFPVSEWCLVNVMLIEWKEEHAERLAVGQIHVHAWAKAEMERKTIVLA